MVIRQAILFLFILAVSACGFHLHNYAQLPPQIKKFYLQTRDPNGPFSLRLARDLRAAGIELVGTPEQAPYTLQVMHADLDKRLTTISANSKVRSYYLTYTANYQVKNNKGKVLLGPFEAKATATYTSIDTQLLGDSDVLMQQQIILIQTVINQIFVQLSSQDAQRILV